MLLSPFSLVDRMFNRGSDIVGKINEPSPKYCSELLAWSNSQLSDDVGMVKEVYKISRKR